MTNDDFARPAHLGQYRESTRKRSGCAGVTLPSFRCACCRRTKLIEGRKMIIKGSPKYGYKCAECVAASQA